MDKQINNDSRRLVTTLTAAGLLPFLLSAGWALFQTINYIPLIIFCYYSAGILCFLAGSLWWHEGQRLNLLFQSNALVLLAVFALIAFHLDARFTLALLAIGLSWSLYLDYFITDYDRWYKRLRLVISTIVILLHLVLLLALPPAH